MKKKLNFNINLKGIDGSDIQPEITLASALSQNLAQSTSGDAVKMYSWAIDLYNGNELELDLVDATVLKETIQSLPISALVKAQMLMVVLS